MDKEIRMLIRVERPEYGGDYFHVIGRPCYAEYEDGEWQPRYFSSAWAHDEEAPLANLEVTSQGDLRTTEPPSPVYAWKVEYKPHSVDLQFAEVMVKQLRRINKRMETMNERLGRADTYAAFLLRVGVILGVEKYGFDQGDAKSSVTGQRWRWTDAEPVTWTIDHQIENLRAGRKPHESEGYRLTVQP
jgi:hypothetical protein